jgi:DHA2 family multidrug resistance protein
VAAAATAATADFHQTWRPRANPWAIAITVTLATFMEALDTSIANVAMPHIGGSLGASPEEATWVLTSYLVANAMVLPISGWIANRIGRKRFYMSCVFLFTVASLLCGIAPTLGMLVFFRVLQGAAGGGLQPSEQSILADTFPPQKRSMAFAVYGVAVVTAPVLGPTVGGWIVDNYTWRWIFFLNIPVGIISLYLSNRLVEDPPYLAEVRKRREGIDYWGLGLLIISIGAIQILLDMG